MTQRSTSRINGLLGRAAYSKSGGEATNVPWFIDQVDIDGDGVAEVVTSNAGLEGWGYCAFR